MANRWIEKPLGELGKALRAGKISSIDLHEEARTRHRTYGPALSAYRVWDETRARAQAEAADAAFRKGEDNGPLQGIPVSVKDLFGVDYLDTYAGTPKPLPDAWRSEGPVIRSVRAQNAVLTGKTHMVEFAFGGLGTNAHWPVPRNPWDMNVARVSGGSSSGAGVSLIEGSALVALGSDTAGSVRVPASVTGTVGLKVTAGRWPTDGIVPLSPTFDTPGILARSVADTAIAFEVVDAYCAGRKMRAIATPAALDGIRIGLAEQHFWDGCPDDIAGAVRDALGELEKAGATLVPVELPEVEEAYALFRQGSVVSSELRAFVESELPDWQDTLDPNVSFRMSSALDLDDEEIIRRRARLTEIASTANAGIKGVDIVITPTVPLTAPALADVVDGKAYSAANLQTLKNTCIGNILEFCAITLPVALDAKGIPVGLQCMGAANTEERLLSAALAIERKLGTARDRLGAPPLATDNSRS
ncbi:MAG: amidase [Hyphomicrobiales bacterium]|nr:amidase [Hyphomicrobiales bacterium]